jgi:cation diffusion facilitator family transporter
VALTGWQILDPLIALAVAGLLAWSGLRLVRRSTLGLMDTALPQEEIQAVEAALQTFSPQGVRWHALRTRQAGARSFVSVHIQVPGRWSVQRGHNLLEQIEDRIRSAIPNASVFTHIEPVEDPASWKDASLDREDGEGEPK